MLERMYLIIDVYIFMHLLVSVCLSMTVCFREYNFVWAFIHDNVLAMGKECFAIRIT